MFSVKGRMLTCTNAHYNTKIQKYNIQIFRTCSLLTQIYTDELFLCPTDMHSNSKTHVLILQTFTGTLPTSHTHTTFIRDPPLVISLSSKQSSLSTSNNNKKSVVFRRQSCTQEHKTKTQTLMWAKQKEKEQQRRKTKIGPEAIKKPNFRVC